jgi:hypothetical protein
LPKVVGSGQHADLILTRSGESERRAKLREVARRHGADFGLRLDRFLGPDAED